MKDYYEARQYISLSSLAYDVIEHDKDEFMTKPSRQGFINRIIESFAEDAQALHGGRFEGEEVGDDVSRAARTHLFLYNRKREVRRLAGEFAFAHVGVPIDVKAEVAYDRHSQLACL